MEKKHDFLKNDGKFCIIKRKIVEIETKYVPLCSVIKELEGRKVFAVDMMNNINRVLFDQPITDKLNDVLDKNEGLTEVRNLDVSKYSAPELLCLNFAPVTSVEVGRSFSMYNIFN